MKSGIPAVDKGEKLGYELEEKKGRTALNFLFQKNNFLLMCSFQILLNRFFIFFN